MEPSQAAGERRASGAARAGIALEIALGALAWAWSGSLAARWSGFALDDGASGLEYLAWAAFATPMWVALVHLALRLRGRPRVSIGWGRPPTGWGRAMRLGLVWGAALSALSWGASELAARAGLEFDTTALDVRSSSSWVGFVAGGVIAGGFGEELVYRGWLLERVERLLDGVLTPARATFAAVVAAALVFGAMHAWQGGGAAAVVALLGLGLGALFVRCGRNLVAPMVAHGVLDVVAFTAPYLAE